MKAKRGHTGIVKYLICARTGTFSKESLGVGGRLDLTYKNDPVRSVTRGTYFPLMRSRRTQNCNNSFTKGRTLSPSHAHNITYEFQGTA